MSFDQNDTGIYSSPRPNNYENVRSFTNDAAEVEYDLDDSPTPSMTEKYVLPSPKSKPNQMQQSKSKNPVILMVGKISQVIYALVCMLSNN